MLSSRELSYDERVDAFQEFLRTVEEQSNLLTAYLAEATLRRGSTAWDTALTASLRLHAMEEASRLFYQRGDARWCLEEIDRSVLRVGKEACGMDKAPFGLRQVVQNTAFAILAGDELSAGEHAYLITIWESCLLGSHELQAAGPVAGEFFFNQLTPWPGSLNELINACVDIVNVAANHGMLLTASRTQ